MDDNVIYYERQRFRQWWLWALMAGVNLIFIIGCVEQLFMGSPFGNNPMSDTGLIAVSATTFIFTVLFFYVTMNTVINKEGIYVWFHPVQTGKKYFSWEEIDRVYIRKYSPIGEYGGWGGRIGFGYGVGSGKGYRRGFGNGFRKKKAYNMSGNIGLQIVLKNGDEILIGTNNPDGMSEVLKKAGKIENDCSYGKRE
ncbi:MAG: hypothetical protein LBC47_05835 [Tannerella sp.]|jgi:hypothetical protein|nr:hypothetical protein [Tannerella sp.]